MVQSHPERLPRQLSPSADLRWLRVVQGIAEVCWADRRLSLLDGQGILVGPGETIVVEPETMLRSAWTCRTIESPVSEQLFAWFAGQVLLDAEPFAGEPRFSDVGPERLLVLLQAFREAAEKLAGYGRERREMSARLLLKSRSFLLGGFPDNPSVSLASKIACMSQWYYVRRFQEQFRCRPGELARHQRLCAAAIRLRRGTETVAEVAAAVGYQNRSSFSREFANEFGLPPGRWRNSRAALGPASASAQPYASGDAEYAEVSRRA